MGVATGSGKGSDQEDSWAQRKVLGCLCRDAAGLIKVNGWGNTKAQALCSVVTETEMTRRLESTGFGGEVPWLRVRSFFTKRHESEKLGPRPMAQIQSLDDETGRGGHGVVDGYINLARGSQSDIVFAPPTAAGHVLRRP